MQSRCRRHAELAAGNEAPGWHGKLPQVHKKTGDGILVLQHLGVHAKTAALSEEGVVGSDSVLATGLVSRHRSEFAT